jgi:membrane-bound ClpP family serine protease
MAPLVWPGLLLLVGLLLVAAEVFLPSGGLLGFLAVASVMSSVVLAFFARGLEVGVLFLCITAVAVPVTVFFAFRWWPKTPMGRRLLLELPRGDEALPDTRRKLRILVGKVGTASSIMLPSGAVLIDGVTLDAVSEGMSVEPGQRVRVVDVRGNRVVVRPLVDDEPESRPADDVLSQSIESLGLDAFDEPLA